MPSTNSNGTNLAGPTNQSERIIILDSLRGIALLGILLMNIPYFAIPDPAADILTVRHELGTINQHVWFGVNWALDGTQRALFSMLFGAGTILFITRLEKRVSGTMPVEYYVRRQLWLLVFGLTNAFVLLWNGDILFEYAIGGIIIFTFRKLPVKFLLIAAGVCLLLATARENRDSYKRKNIIAKGEAIAKLDTTKTKITDVQKEQLGAMTAIKERADSASMQKEMQKNLREFKGSYAQLYENVSTFATWLEFQLSYYEIWDILLMMFLGMAFFKSGVLTGEAPVKIYWWLCIVGLSVGLTLSYLRLHPYFVYNFNSFEYRKHAGFQYYQISRMLRSLGVFGLIMLLYKSGWFKWVFALTRPVGQMAFTNYLMQSFMCGLFFYGIGFGMYGRLQRYEVYYVALAVWTIEIIWSHVWLRYFRFGPLEWLWRSLTYWKKQPLKKVKKIEPAMELEVA